MLDTGILEKQDECVFLSLSVSSLNVFGLCSLKCVFTICMVLLLVSSLCLIFFFVHERGLCLVFALPDLALLSLCVSASHLGALCPAYLSFFLFVNWLFVTLSPCSFDILPFSDSTVSTLSWLSLFHMSFLPLLGHLLSFFMLCVLLCLFVFCDFPFHQSFLFSFLLCFPPSTDFCVFQPLHESVSPPPWCPVLFSPCIFFVPVCVCSCVHVCDKGASKPFLIGAECQLSK